MKTEIIEKIEDLLDINMIQGVPFFDNKKHGNVAFFIISILAQDSFLKKNILEVFESEEEVYPDLVSSLENSNCSCKKRVINFFEKKFFPDFFDKIKSFFLYEECGNDKLNQIYKMISNHVRMENSNRSNENVNSNLEKSVPETKIVEQEDKQEDKQDNIKRLPQNIGINYVEIMNMLPNIESISGKFVTIAVWHYEPLFNALKLTNCKYNGVSIHKEGNVLHLFFS
jgi:hypothetical protein